MHLLAADRIRFGRRRDLWILAALVPVILVVMFLSEFNSLTTPPQDNFFIDPPDPVLQAQLHDQMIAEFRQQVAEQLPAFAFPASLVKVAGNVGPMILLAIYLATALIAGEFEWGTVRTIHLTSRRGWTMAVRIGVVVGLIAVVTAVGLAFAAIIPFLLSFEGRPIQDLARPVPGLVSDVGIRLMVVLPFISIPAFMAVLGRSTAFAFIFTLLFIVFDLALTGAPFWPSSPTPWAPALTVTGSINRLLSEDRSPLAAIAPSWASVLALLGWALVPAAGAIARFRRLDLNE
jgi:ABC-2 family transporter protein